MSMKVTKPTLSPNIRQTSFIDYQSLSQAEITKCDRQIEEFKRSRTISCPTSKSYFKIMCVLRERRRLLLLAKNILEAGEVDRLIREISDFFQENKLYVAKREKVGIAEAEFEAERSHLADVESKWQQDHQRLSQRRSAAQARAAENARAAIANYDESMPDQLPPEFTRLSADLLDLREKERHLIGSRRFDEAAQLHREFERRQREELVRRREEYFAHFEQERLALERRNARKARAIEDDYKRRMDHLIHTRDSEVIPLRGGVANLLNKLTTRKAEYIGEDDMILTNDPGLARARDAGNIFRTGPPAFTRGTDPRSMVSARREIERPTPLMSAKQMSDAMYRQNRKLDSRRWP
jgi:hypothetical protein